MMLYDKFALDSTRSQPQTLKHPLIPIPICTLQIFEQLRPLMDESSQVSPAGHIALKLAEMAPHIPYLQRQQRRYPSSNKSLATSAAEGSGGGRGHLGPPCAPYR